jgi:hypothetical protein
MEGGVEETVEQIVDALQDPYEVSARLGGRSWAIPRYDAAEYVPMLDALYKRVSGGGE